MSSQKILAVKVLNHPWEKTRGLIGAKKPYPVFFTTRFGIHTFGLRFPIDVLILDSQFMVVKAKKQLSPNRLFFWSIFYKHVLELPAGEITRRKIKIGEKIKLLKK
jgi:hypothetical protein